jgi:ABC-2 type transport system ATP-binding protein
MIKIENLQKVIKNVTVLDITALEIKLGEVVAIIGPVGSGKKHLLDILIGNSQPTVGRIHIADVSPYKSDKTSRVIGVLFQSDGHYARQTALQNLMFHARLFNVEKARVPNVLMLVGLADHANSRVDKLSTGLRRRLAFGRAVLHQPKVLVLENPFVRCDEASIDILSRIMRQLAQEGTTVLILADDNANLNTICDRVYVLNQGRISDNYNPKDEQQNSLPFIVPVRLEGRVALIKPVDILFADAGEGRAFLHTREGRLPTQFNLTELEERLSRSGFFRAHRSYLVNLQHVKEVIPYTRNSYSLLLSDDASTEIPLSKTAAGELRELLGY